MNAILAFALRILLILLSYLFVGWITYTIYIDLRKTVQGKTAISVPILIIRAEIENEIIEKQFNIPEIIIGRDPACDFPLQDETISHRHCKLYFHQKQWWAEDLDSTNGSYLNDTLMESPIILTDGDTLRLGRMKTLIFINETIWSKND